MQSQGRARAVDLPSANRAPTAVDPPNPSRAPRAQTFKKLIGEGSIGRVHLGRWQETDVAIKVLTSLGNIAVGMASASPTPRAGGAPGAARNEAGDSYADDALATKRTLEREARAPRRPHPYPSRSACVNLAATCAYRTSGKCRCLR